MAVKCPECNTENPADSKFCKECAAPIPSADDISAAHTKTLETSKEELTTGSIFAGRYQIIEDLGKGGMGKVYKAQDTEINEKVAIKLLKPEVAADKKTIERFRNELKFARKIRHKNVCQMFDLGEEKGTRFITMEYVSGEDLKRLIRKVGQLSAGKTVSIAKQVCEGLVEAHKIGIVHRDLKPQNIMVDEDGNARIMDFGIARSIRGKGITGSGVMIGTPEYMSPEQVESKETDQRSDIYSLGVILYEMVTGNVPFDGDTPFTVGIKHKSEIPQDPKELNTQIPEDLSRLILRCLEKNTEKRYQSAGEVRSELDRIEKGIPTTERDAPKKRPATSKEITVTFNLKKLFIPALVGIALVVAVVMIWQVFLKKKAVSQPPQKPSIAVLPFEDLSPEKDQGYFCDGMTAEIIAKLSGLQGWKVSPRTSVMRYKNAEKDIKEIGLELDVTAVLEGSIRKEEDDIRIIATLINTADSSQLWSDIYDQKLDRVFAIQSDIAEKITKALRMELSPEEKERLEKKPTQDLTAYDYYLKGREYYERYRKLDNEQAIKLFQKALEIDENYALAYAGLGDAYAQMSVRFGGFDIEWLDLSLDASQTAISIDPNCAEAYKALGLVYFYRGWVSKAIEANQRAIEINPNLDTAITNLALDYLYIGEFEKGIELAEINLALLPTDPWAYHMFALFYYALDDLTRAERWEGKSLELRPDFTDSNAVLILVYLVQGKYQKALEHSQKFLSMYPRNIAAFLWVGETFLIMGDFAQARQYYEKRVEISPGRLNGMLGIRNSTRLGYIYWISGDKEEAQKLFNMSLSLDQEQLEQGSELWGIRNDLAVIHTVQGNKKEAYKWLKKSIEAGCRDFRLGQREPMYENLRDDEQFKQMMADLKESVDEMRKRIEKNEK